jgi:hypothetical protein
VAFQQVFFSGDRPHGGAEKAAAEALERAEEGGREDPTADPFLFPLAYDDVAVQLKTLATAAGSFEAVRDQVRDAWMVGAQRLAPSSRATCTSAIA